MSKTQNRKWKIFLRAENNNTEVRRQEAEVENPEASLASHATQKSKLLRRILEAATDTLTRSG